MHNQEKEEWKTLQTANQDTHESEIRKLKRAHASEKEEYKKTESKLTDLQRDLNSLRAVAAQANSVSNEKGHLENEVEELRAALVRTEARLQLAEKGFQAEEKARLLAEEKLTGSKHWSRFADMVVCGLFRDQK